MSDEQQKSGFHNKYRPNSLDQIIGHEQAVTRLRGALKENDLGSALLFIAPTSGGKTTLARALAVAINGKPIKDQGGDYFEMNGSSERSIEDIRNIIKVSKFKPMGNKKRIIVIDEAQGIVSNKPAKDALLKPLEEPSPHTLWILCSMDPAKFASGEGKSLANRCEQYILKPFTNMDLLKQAVRIAKGEKMDYVLDAENKHPMLKEIVRNCEGEMRTLANIMQATRNYASGLDKRPKKLTKEQVMEVLQSTEAADDKRAVDVMASVYGLQYRPAHTALLDVENHFQLISRMLWLSKYMLDSTALAGKRHNKVWPSTLAKELVARVKDVPLDLGRIAALHECLVQTKAQAQSFAVEPGDLITSKLYRFVKDQALLLEDTPKRRSKESDDE
jgi:DNA polymerase III delta prime subunit